MILIDAEKLRNEIKKSDGYADSEYGKGICAGISRALQKLDEAETFDLEKHDEEVRTDERMKVLNETRMFVDKNSVEIGRRKGIREFAEWLLKHNKFDLAERMLLIQQGIDSLIAEYEEEQKNERI